MQILEASLYGLRAARMLFTHRKTGTVVSLFPVIHVAEPDFYDQVFASAFDENDVVLTEGIASPIVRRITRSYRWMVGKGGGLVLQSDATPENAAARRVLADLTSEEFRALWRDVPLMTRLLITAGAPLMGLWQRLNPDLASLARRLELDDLAGRDRILGWSPETAALDHAILVARDARLIETLTQEIADSPPGGRIAVVYGAAHMPAVLRALHELGYTLTDTVWLNVFRT